MSQDDNSDLARLRSAVLDEPRNAKLRYLLGAEMAQAGDYDGAVLEFSAALGFDPTLHVARLQLGLLHLTLAQPHHTATVLAPLEDLADDAALKYFKRGLEALIEDDFQACLKNLRRGIGLNQESEPLNRDMLLVISQVNEVLAANETAEDSAVSGDGVRTDFSLYSQTKH